MNLKSEQDILSNFISNEITISICCLAYNHGAFIKQTIEGFLLQKTSFKFEILIHDDASKDNTSSIIQDFERKYPNLIKPIYQSENQHSKGGRVNFRFNFPRVSGKYIALCEGDDYWTDPFKLQKQVDFLETNKEYSICFHNVAILQDNSFRKSNIPYPNGEILLSEYIKKGKIFTTSIVFRNEYLKYFAKEILKSPLMDKTIKTLLLTKGKGYYFEEEMGVYRHHTGGVFSTLNKINKNLLSLKGDYFNQKVLKINKKLYLQSIEQKTLFLMYECLRNKRFKIFIEISNYFWEIYHFKLIKLYYRLILKSLNS